MTQEKKRILCSIGMRGNCDHVLEQAADLALVTGAELHILHVARSFPEDMYNTLKTNIRDRETLNALLEQRLEERRTELAEKVETACTRYPALQKMVQEQRVTQLVREGYPGSIIAHFATDGGFSMIVMAANKQGSRASYAGKITKGVIKRATVPVVVVPAAP
ncbi:universal stress protein [Halomonas piscis]|uniref:Universal stress protein n=1 Tax=Halomonas piscis TaxID=3031727 RepID=A0ABY9YYE1_9GAMM|nr:universal stress protein [Halomonas piscis]WNK19878.1 universal stress protein [Halomonas piscis]